MSTAAVAPVLPCVLAILAAGLAGPPAEFTGRDAVTSTLRLPDNFIIGASTSSYQIEGAWNISGRGLGAPDVALADRSDGAGQVACDSYHKYKEDVRMLKLMGATHYRFSISWSRLMPDGEEVNPDGVRYYNALLDELEANNIKAMVTIMHMEYPYVLEEKFRGWNNKAMVDYFETYAVTVFKLFGDRVSHWVTINEPHMLCAYGAGHGGFGMLVVEGGVADYMCGHHMLLAHARAYRAFTKLFPGRKGMIGMALSNFYTQPCTTSYKDVNAAERHQQFELGWFMDPLMFGQYPPTMRERVDMNSLAEGRNKSRLPVFSEKERAQLRGSFDFVGINLYYGYSACDGVPEGAATPSYERDMEVVIQEVSDPTKPPTNKLVTPWSVRATLSWIKNRYYFGNEGRRFPIIVTENGFPSDGSEGLYDQARISYISSYLREILVALYYGDIDIIGYFVWSLMDNFEWSRGYETKYGLVEVDFSSPNLTRTPRDSLLFMRDVISNRVVPEVPMPSAASSLHVLLVPAVLFSLATSLHRHCLGVL